MCVCVIGTPNCDETLKSNGYPKAQWSVSKTVGLAH